VAVPIKLSNFYHGEPLAEIRTGVYDFSQMLREAVLLEVPHFAECKGNCPQRVAVKKYLKQPMSPEEQAADEGYLPFAGLDDIDLNKKKKTKLS
jgi:hypothetical protein